LETLLSARLTTLDRPSPAAADALEASRGETPKKVFVKSFGCQMNVYDSQRMSDIAGDQGYRAVETIDEADLVILNTCHIRERASEKIFSELGKIRELKERRAENGRGTTIVVAGCVAQAEGGEIIRRQPAVDVVVGPQNYHRLPSLLQRAADGGRGLVDTEFPLESKFDSLPAAPAAAIRARGVAAFVTVQEGCDKFCSFCVVPYTRGAETSRPVVEVLAEIDRLTAAGVREVTLIGQNVNAYHGLDANGRPCGLAALVARVAARPGVRRVRYTTSHPGDMSKDLIDAHRDQPALAPYLHLPVQSGSDRVLAAMNRGHTAKDYLEIVAALRAARSDLALSSDFIVGFPGESEAEFVETLDLIRTVGFASSYSFKYSARPGTPGAESPRQIDEATKVDRLARLQILLEEQRQTFNRSLVGRVLTVLLEKPGRYPGQLIGRSPYMQSVLTTGETALIGVLADIEITEVGPNSLRGRILGAQERQSGVDRERSY
jgi:tRNA-2-methylthio-N6-dimethylallyladenosine synthase